MKGEEARQRRKEGRTKNGERSRHKAKNKGKHRDSRLGSQEAEDVPLVSQQKQPAEEKVAMARLHEESAVAVCLQVLLPYMLAGLGMVLAGMVLDYVQVRETVSFSVGVVDYPQGSEHRPCQGKEDLPGIGWMWESLPHFWISPSQF